VRDAAGERIALFPLASVLYPGLLLPLHIFEERYRNLVADLVARPDEPGPRSFGVVAIRAGREVGAGVLGAAEAAPALHEVGCTAELRSVEAYPDGRFDIVTVGVRRFRLLALDTSLSYLQGQVQWLDEPAGGSPGELAASVLRQYGAYRDTLTASQRRPRAGDALPADPEALSYVVAASMVLDLGDRQSLLAATDTSTRLLLELGLLRREAALLRVLPSLPAVDLARQPPSPN